ncbi:MAG: hypothetical protein ACI4FO_02160 [Acutalibacteraceae bacterium]
MKKSRTSLFRILILSLVMLVTVFIIAIAWFSTKNQATASGLSVKAVSGLGLECSFTNTNDYSVEIARNPITNNFRFPLITGDGKNFFIPALNRTTGSPLTDNSGAWYSKRPAQAARYSATSEGYTEGDYYVEDIWFRSNKPIEVYLSSDSSIEPFELGVSAEEMLRKSQYGSFSMDNIAGAARVAFFQCIDGTVDGKDCSDYEPNAPTKEAPEFIWIPNQTYQLLMSDNMAPIPDHITGSGQATFDPNDPLKTFGIKDSNGKIVSGYTPATNMFLGEINYKVEGSGADKFNSSQSVQMYKVDSTSDTYYAAIDVQSTSQVDHGIFITDTKWTAETSDNGYTNIPAYDAEASKQGHECWLTYTINGQNIWVGAYFDSQGTVLNGSKVEKLTIEAEREKTDFFTENTFFQLLIAYSKSRALGGDQQLKVVGLVCYNKTGATTPGDTYGKYNGAAGIGPGDKIVPGYVIDFNEKDGSTVVIANRTTSVSEDAYGLNVVSESTNAVKLDIQSKTVTTDSGIETYLSPQNPLPSQLFSVSKTATGAYRFRSLSSGKYLNIDVDNQKVIVSSTPADFTLSGSAETGPRISTIVGSTQYYITYNNGEFGISTDSTYAGLQIYQGSGFDFTYSGLREKQYEYYKEGSPAKTILSPATKTTMGYLPSYDANGDCVNTLDTKPVAVLQQTSDPTGQSYMAHIRVVIWAEGTDREAKIPLAGGIFKTHLVFQGKLIEEQDKTTA